jgi:hypothetical protein
MRSDLSRKRGEVRKKALLWRNGTNLSTVIARSEATKQSMGPQQWIASLRSQ